MPLAVIAIVACCSAAFGGEKPLYLNTLLERFDASDLVCTGIAKTPVRTGKTKYLDGDERDELASRAKIETCFKGASPTYQSISILGYSVTARSNSEKGFVYSGPPTGFVYEGRNLLFLRRIPDSRTFEVTVPIYQSALRLAEHRPYYPEDHSPEGIKFALTKELEAALVQFDENSLEDLLWIFDLLGENEAVKELKFFSRQTPLPVQRDIAVALLQHGDLESEPMALSLLRDTSAPAWKREGAASALGGHGTERALKFLRDVALQPATTDELKSLRLVAVEALAKLKERCGEPR